MASRTRPAVNEQSDMSFPYIPAALARERQDTLLAEADAVRLARQARSYRRGHTAPAGRRSPLRARGWLLAWPWSGGSLPAFRAN